METRTFYQSLFLEMDARVLFFQNLTQEITELENAVKGLPGLNEAIKELKDHIQECVNDEKKDLGKLNKHVQAVIKKGKDEALKILAPHRDEVKSIESRLLTYQEIRDRKELSEDLFEAATHVRDSMRQELSILELKEPKDEPTKQRIEMMKIVIADVDQYVHAYRNEKKALERVNKIGNLFPSFKEKFKTYFETPKLFTLPELTAIVSSKLLGSFSAEARLVALINKKFVLPSNLDRQILKIERDIAQLNQTRANASPAVRKDLDALMDDFKKMKEQIKYWLQKLLSPEFLQNEIRPRTKDKGGFDSKGRKFKLEIIAGKVNDIQANLDKLQALKEREARQASVSSVAVAIHLSGSEDKALAALQHANKASTPPGVQAHSAAPQMPPQSPLRPEPSPADSESLPRRPSMTGKQ